jgi:hypothetical protein
MGWWRPVVARPRRVTTTQPAVTSAAAAWQCAGSPRLSCPPAQLPACSRHHSFARPVAHVARPPATELPVCQHCRVAVCRRWSSIGTKAAALVFGGPSHGSRTRLQHEISLSIVMSTETAAKITQLNDGCHSGTVRRALAMHTCNVDWAIGSEARKGSGLTDDWLRRAPPLAGGQGPWAGASQKQGEHAAHHEMV